MAKHKLTDRMVKQANRPGVLLDGGGLRLKIQAGSGEGQVRRYWVLRTKVRNGPLREISLGSAADVTLASARDNADAIRRAAREGHDPVQARRAAARQAVANAASQLTFKECAERYIAGREAEWSGPKQAAQWRASLRTYAYPILGRLPVAEIELDHVFRALNPIWREKTTTATRVRERIESVLNYAITLQARSRPNPAEWRGNLRNLLPVPGKVSPVEHHAAVPVAEVSDFFSAVSRSTGVAAACLQFLILTCVRYSNATGARWSEIDLHKRVWNIPASRMKGRQPHRVPLSRAACAILEARLPFAGSAPNDLVFESSLREGAPLSNGTLAALMRRAGWGNYTPHGFRSSFRDWAAEETSVPSEVAERVLAHTIRNQTIAAYERTDLFEKRARLMQRWAAHCLGQKQKKRGPKTETTPPALERAA